MPKRTALLIDITTFSAGQDGVDGDGEPLPGRLRPLEYTLDVDRLGKVLEIDFQFTVERRTNLSSAQLGALVTTVLESHRAGDVIIIHVLTHGRLNPHFRGINVIGSDGTSEDSADVKKWLDTCAKYGNSGPHVLFLLDICHAGEAVQIDKAMRRGAAKRTWLLAAAPAGDNAFDARFTRSLSDVLARIAGDPKARLDLNPGDRYVPLYTFANQVRQATYDLADREGLAARQEVTGTQIDIAAPDAATVPFFPNPRYRADVAAQTPRDLAGVGDHRQARTFIAAASGYPPGETGDGLFTGRTAELSTLLDWATADGKPGLLVVTGRAGAGKSALLGMVVCTVHPQLSKVAMWLRRPLGAPLPTGRMAAVNVRQLDITGVVLMLGAQLTSAKDARTPSAIVDAIRRAGDRPILVVDALDEALDPASLVTDLLVPLAKIQACRMVVGVRSEELAARLSPLGDQMDLNVVDRETLRNDLETYATHLLRRIPPYSSRDYLSGRAHLAASMATALTGDRRSVWGEYLTIRLYVQNLREPIKDVELAEKTGRAIPLDPADLHLIDRSLWFSPVLSAVAWAHGYGMPSDVIPEVAAALDGELFHQPTPDQVAAVLDAADPYLRRLPGDEGFVLYQIFHEGLVERLRVPSQARVVFDALLSTVPKLPDGRLRWDLAAPYVQRHALDHAREADALGELLGDAGYLLCGSLDERLDALAELGEAGRAPIAVIKAYRAMPADTDSAVRRMALAIEAIRYEGRELAEALSDGLFRPVWHVRPTPERRRPDGPSPLIITCDGGSTVQVHDPDGTPVGPPMRHSASVRAMTTVRYEDGYELLCGGNDHTATVWSLDPIDSDARLVLRGHRGPIRCITYAVVEGRAVAVTGSQDQTVRVWDLEDGEMVGKIASYNGPVLDVAVLPTADGAEIVATRTNDGVQVRNLNDDHSRRVDVPIPSAGAVTLAISTDYVPIAMQWTAGRVRVLNLNTGSVELMSTPHSGDRATVVGDQIVISGDNWLRRWTAGEVRDWVELPSAVHALSGADSDGRLAVLVSTADGLVQLRDLGGGVRAEFHLRSPASLLAFAEAAAPAAAPPLSASIDAGLGFGGVVVAAGDTSGRLWIRTPAGKVARQVDHPVDSVSVRSRDGWAVVGVHSKYERTTVIHPCTGRTLKIPGWNFESRKPEVDWTLTDQEAVTATGADDGTLAVGEQSWTAHSGPIRAVAVWQYSGRVLAASGGADAMLRVWDARDHALLWEFQLPAPVRAMRASADQLVVHAGDEVLLFEQRPPESSL